jgi:histidinol-phosphate aminotransferase
MELIRKDIDNIEAYKPGKPIEEVKRELGIADVTKLASNENALGPSPKAIAAAKQALPSLNRYPEGSCYYLKRKLARILGVRETNLLFGNGSDELIDVILKTIKAPDAKLSRQTSPSSNTNQRRHQQFSCGHVPLKDFTFDPEAMVGRITQKTKAVLSPIPTTRRGHTSQLNRCLNFSTGSPQES